MRLSKPQIKALRQSNDWLLYSPDENGKFVSGATVDALIVRGMLSARFPNSITEKGEQYLEAMDAD